MPMHGCKTPIYEGALVAGLLLASPSLADLNLGETEYGSRGNLKTSMGILYSSIYAYGPEAESDPEAPRGILVTQATADLVERARFFIETSRDGADIAPADNGDVFVASSYFDSVVISGKTYGRDSGDYPDFFVARLSGSGEVRWLKVGRSNGDIVKMKVWGGVIHLLGNARREFMFDGEEPIEVGSQNPFVLQLGEDGSRKGLVVAGGSGFITARDFDRDSRGNFYFGGDYMGADALPDAQLDYQQGSDALAFKTDSQGKLLGYWTIGGALADNGYAIGSDAEGNAYFTGRVLGKASKGDVVLESTQGNFFLIKFDAGFRPAWAVKTFGNGYAEGNRILVQNAKEILVAGSFAGTLNFGTGALSGGDRLNCYDIRDAFLLSLDDQGAVRAVERFGGTYEDFGHGLATVGKAIYVLNAVDFGKRPEHGPRSLLARAGTSAVFEANAIRLPHRVPPASIRRAGYRLDGKRLKAVPESRGPARFIPSRP